MERVNRRARIGSGRGRRPTFPPRGHAAILPGMRDVPFIWLIASGLSLAAIVGVRSARLGRLLRLGDLRWRGAIGLALLAGAAVAVVYSFLIRSDVEVPPEVIERTVIPDR